jgi:outer membrane protein OmpA-like peptidoglycan-associated protein
VYEHRFGETKRYGLYAALGGKLQIPVQSKFSVSDGKYPQDSRLNVSGFYRNNGNLELGAPGDPDLSQHGFGTIINPKEALDWKGDIKLKNSYALTGDLGVLVGLTEQFDLALGIYADYGINDIKKEGNQPLLKANGSYLPGAEQHIGKGITYSGLINSDRSSDVKLLSFGVKIGLRFKLGKSGKNFKKEAVAPVIVPVEKTNTKEIEDRLGKIEDLLTTAKEVAPEAPAVAEQSRPSELDALYDKIFFDLNSSVLRPESKLILDKKAALLKKYPDVKIRILGSTCDLGTEVLNVQLGISRANETKKYLIEKGIDSGRLIPASQLNLKPAESGDIESSRALERNCEFEIID